MLLVLPRFVGPPIDLIGGIFITVTGLSVYMLYFVNMITVRWSAPYVTNYDCDAKDTYFDTLSTSLSLNYFMTLLYRKIMLHYHIILSGR